MVADAARLHGGRRRSPLIAWLYRHEGRASTASKCRAGRPADRAGPPGDLHALRGGALGRSRGAAEPDDHGGRLGERGDRRPVRRARGARRPPGAGRLRRGGDRTAESGRVARPGGGRDGDDPAGDRQGADPQGPGAGCSASCGGSTGSGSIASRTRPSRWPRSTGRPTSSRRSPRSARCEAAGTQTRLGDGVRQVLTELRGPPPSAIVLFTDGQTTEGESLSKAAELAARKGVPLYTVGLGSPEPARDLELSELLVDDVVFVDDAVRFQAKLSARGFAGEKVVVRLKEREPGSTRPEVGPGARDRRRSTRPATASPKRVELVYRPQDDRRADLHRRGRAPAPRAPDRQQPHRAARHRPQGEAQGPLPRQRAAVRVPLPEELPGARRVDRPEHRPALVDPGVQRAGPLRPADLPGLQGRAVRLRRRHHRRRRYQLPQPVADAEPRRSSSPRRGAASCSWRASSSTRCGYRGTPLELLLPIELADARNPTAVGTSVTSFRPELTIEGRAQPDLPPGRQRGRQHADLERAPRAVLVSSRPRARSPRRRCWPNTRRRPAPEGKLPLIVYQFLGAGKVMFHAFDDTWRWRFRAGDRYFGRFWVQTIRFMARSRLVGQPPGGDPDRPPPLPARAADPAPRPLPQPGPGPGRRRGHDPDRAQGPGPAQADAQARARVEERLRGRLAAGRRGGIRGPAPAAADPRAADHGRIPRRSADQRARTHRDEPARADPGGRAQRRASSTRRSTADSLLKDLPEPSPVLRLRCSCSAW